MIILLEIGVAISNDLDFLDVPEMPITMTTAQARVGHAIPVGTGGGGGGGGREAAATRRAGAA